MEAFHFQFRTSTVRIFITIVLFFTQKTYEPPFYASEERFIHYCQRLPQLVYPIFLISVWSLWISRIHFASVLKIYCLTYCYTKSMPSFIYDRKAEKGKQKAGMIAWQLLYGKWCLNQSDSSRNWTDFFFTLQKTTIGLWKVQKPFHFLEPSCEVPASRWRGSEFNSTQFLRRIRVHRDG